MLLTPRKKSWWMPPRTVVVGGGGGSLINFVSGSIQGSTTFDHTTDTHGPFSVGAPQAGNKLIILPAIIAEAFGTVDGPYCNGTLMNLVGAPNNGGSQVITNIWYLEVAGSVTSVTFVLNDVAPHTAAMQGSILGVYWASGMNPVPASHVENPKATISGPATQDTTITVPTGGLVVYVAHNTDHNDTVVLSGTPVTLDALENTGTLNFGIAQFAHLTAAGSATISAKGLSGGYVLSSAAVAFGPP